MKYISPLRFVSINIEQDKHLDSVLVFLKEQNPDIVCLQEVFERDIPRFEKELGMRGLFSPMSQWSSTSNDTTEIILIGVGIFTRLPVTQTFAQYYSGDLPTLHIYAEQTNNADARVFLSAVIDVFGTLYTVGTTHFTWSAHGEADDRQRNDVKSFLEKLNRFSDGIVFAGDFNAPRGKEIFSEIEKRFKDNIPKEYMTSLDQSLHRAPDAVRNLMVDGIFSTPEYVLTNVALHFGVSDHAAIVADVEKKE
jgi:endonuclease/exonuclease/phosphatase family metal-dependent hydrolase